jgi:hypothetical protein
MKIQLLKSRTVFLSLILFLSCTNSEKSKLVSENYFEEKSKFEPHNNEEVNLSKNKPTEANSIINKCSDCFIVFDSLSLWGNNKEIFVNSSKAKFYLNNRLNRIESFEWFELGTEDTYKDTLHAYNVNNKCILLTHKVELNDDYHYWYIFQKESDSIASGQISLGTLQILGWKSDDIYDTSWINPLYKYLVSAKHIKD